MVRKNLVFHPKVPGVSTSFELAIRFAKWAEALQATPSMSQIVSTYSVSRATAYRWRAAWLAANGQSDDAVSLPASHARAQEGFCQASKGEGA